MTAPTSSLPTIKSIDEAQEGHGVFEIMDRSGDTKHTWDPKKSGEVEAAKALFETLKSKGQLIYRLGRFGGKGEVMREFDADAGRLVAIPPVTGG